MADDTVISNRIQALNSNGNIFKLAEVAFEGENYLEAINYYNKCLEIDSDFFEAWFKKGISIIYRNSIENYNSKEAIVSLKQAVNFAPNSEKFIKRLKKDIIPFLSNFYLNILNNTDKFDYAGLNNINQITDYIIVNCLLNEEEKKSLNSTLVKFKKSFAEYFLVKNQSMFEVEKFDFVVSELDKFIHKLNNDNKITETENEINIKNNKTFFTNINDWAVKNPKIFWPIGLTLIFLMVKLIININAPNPTWCDCDKAAGDAIDYSVFRGRNGSTAKYDEKTIKACAKKVLKLNKTLNIEPDELSIEYISQFSYEICKNGYYEGKGSDNRGKKYYPEAD